MTAAAATGRVTAAAAEAASAGSRLATAWDSRLARPLISPPAGAAGAAAWAAPVLTSTSAGSPTAILSSSAVVASSVSARAAATVLAAVFPCAAKMLASLMSETASAVAAGFELIGLRPAPCNSVVDSGNWTGG